MATSVTVITKAGLDEFALVLKAAGCIPGAIVCASELDPFHLQLRSESGDAYVDIVLSRYSELAVDDYFDNEVLNDDFRQSVPGATIVGVCFRGRGFLRQVLGALAPAFGDRLADTWVDDVYGHVIKAVDCLRAW